jgi:rod shape-determining protein MreD
MLRAADKGVRAMIMPRGADQLLLPVNPLFIAASLLFALGFNLIPLGRQAAMPDLLALVLVFWNVHQPLRVGVGIAFVLGLLMDVHQGALFGQHALAYTLLSFLAVTIHRRLLWFSVLEQALQVWPLFAAAHGVSLAVRMASGGSFPWMAAADCADAGGCVVAAGGVGPAGAATPRARSRRKPAAVTTRPR